MKGRASIFDVALARPAGARPAASDCDSTMHSPSHGGAPLTPELVGEHCSLFLLASSDRGYAAAERDFDRRGRLGPSSDEVTDATPRTSATEGGAPQVLLRGSVPPAAPCFGG